MGKGGHPMSYEELVNNVKKAMQNTIVSKTIGHTAFQFNIEGEAEGAFYLEISEGKIYVEPYEYYDRDIIIFTTADIVMQLVECKLQARAAYSNGLLHVHGDVVLLDVLPLGRDYKVNSRKSCISKQDDNTTTK